jgi:hypothetical protein
MSDDKNTNYVDLALGHENDSPRVLQGKYLEDLSEIIT